MKNNTPPPRFVPQPRPIVAPPAVLAPRQGAAAGRQPLQARLAPAPAPRPPTVPAPFRPHAPVPLAPPGAQAGRVAQAALAVGATLGVAAIGVALVPAARNAVIDLFNRTRAYFSAPTAPAITTPSTTSSSKLRSSSSSAGKATKKHQATSASTGSAVGVRPKPPSLIEQARLAGVNGGSQNWSKYLKTIKDDSRYKNGNSTFRDSIYEAYRAGALSLPDPTIPTVNVNVGGYVPVVASKVKPRLTDEELAEQRILAEAAFKKKVNSAKQRLMALRGKSENIVSILLDPYGNEICTGRNGGIADEGTPNAAKVLPVTYVKVPNHVNGYGSACAEAHAIVKWSNSGKRPRAAYSLAYGPDGFKSACGTCKKALRLYQIEDLIDY